MSICFIDYRATKEEINNLKKLGHEVIKVPKCDNLYEAIDGHPDIQIHITSQKKIIIHPNMNKDFIKELESLNLSFSFSEEKLEKKYPKNIYLNAISTKEYFIHNLNYTSKNLINENKDKTLINVKQGYTKCSTAVINNNSIITSDKGIFNKLISYNFDVLLIPAGNILLPGLNYGFIGGCCGVLPKNKITFFGSLEKYPYKDEILKFLSKKNLEPIYLSNSPLIDRGSLLVL